MLKFSRTILNRALKQHGATNLRIFGSAARNELRETSDIDVLVDIKDPPRGRLFARAGLSESLAQVFGRPVDVVFSDDAFAKKIKAQEIREL